MDVRAIERGDRLVVFVHEADNGDVSNDLIQRDLIREPVSRRKSNGIASRVVNLVWVAKLHESCELNFEW